MNKAIDTITASVLALPYNVGPIILALILWMFCCYFGYWNSNNFDMLSSIESYIVGLGLISILIGALGHERWRKLIKLGIITKVTAIFALVTSKSVAVSALGVWILSPVSMFCFFMLLKNIWIAEDHA